MRGEPGMRLFEAGAVAAQAALKAEVDHPVAAADLPELGARDAGRGEVDAGQQQEVVGGHGRENSDKILSPSRPNGDLG